LLEELEIESQKKKLKELVEKLPPNNRAIFIHLMTFLKLVRISTSARLLSNKHSHQMSCYSSKNKMSILNLALIFAPTILRKRVETKVIFCLAQHIS